jgi:N6-L-threonylcarbamoyladenine synthase
MRILAIETSCDETAVALLACEGTVEAPDITVIKQALFSQAKDHVAYGGVFPTLAKREHAKNLVPLFLEATESLRSGTDSRSMIDPEKEKVLREMLSREGELTDFFMEHIVPLPRPDIDAIAVTQGPGLEPALWVGISFAKALSYLWDIPLVPVDHMEGHICSVLVNGIDSQHATRSTQQIQYPALALLVSGGHTELVLAEEPLMYKKLGETRDDAVGEAFDKVARLLGLPYPGGPEISRLAQLARDKFQIPSSKFQTKSKFQVSKPEHEIRFPRPMIQSDDFDFSYAGLKTAVLYKVRELGELSDEQKETIAREFEEAAIDVLIAKTKKALEAFGAKTLIVGGGVAANDYLREHIAMLVEDFPETTLLISDKSLSVDNAIMIGIAGYLRSLKQKYLPYHGEDIRAYGTSRPSFRR